MMQMVINRSWNHIINCDSPGYILIQHFHTHGQACTEEDAVTPSEEDYEFKKIITEKYPNIELIILHTYGKPVHYEDKK